MRSVCYKSWLWVYLVLFCVILFVEGSSGLFLEESRRKAAIEKELGQLAKTGSVDEIAGKFFQRQCVGSRLYVKEDVFVKLARTIPNVEKVVRVMTGDWNPVLNEVWSVYASMVHNVGAGYGREDVEDLSKVLLNAYFKSAKPHIEAFAFHEEYGGIQDFGHMYSGPVAVVKVGGRFVDLSLASVEGNKVEGLEFRRKRNPDKSGFDKYRVRDAVFTRDDGTAGEQAYRPAPGWTAEDWISRPSRATVKMRACIFETVDYLRKQGIKAFSVSEGGAFKGTATEGTDVDTVIYVEGGKHSDRLFMDAEKEFERQMGVRGVGFKKYSSYVCTTKAPDEKRKIFERRGHEEGFLVYDGVRPNYVRGSFQIDLDEWRSTGEVKVESVTPKVELKPPGQKKDKPPGGWSVIRV